MKNERYVSFVFLMFFSFMIGWFLMKDDGIWFIISVAGTGVWMMNDYKIYAKLKRDDIDEKYEEYLDEYEREE